MKGPLLLLLAVVLVVGGTVAVVCLTPGCNSPADPFLDEVSALATVYSVEWDATRDEYGEGQQKEEARRAWRVRWAKDLRALCLRHGRAEPPWVNDVLRGTNRVRSLRAPRP